MPVRYRALRQALHQLGYELEERAGKGSHTVVYLRQRQLSYTLPLHHGEGTELTDVYVRGLCRKFGIDYRELRKLL